jgi:hypothetical protein
MTDKIFDEYTTISGAVGANDTISITSSLPGINAIDLSWAGSGQNNSSIYSIGSTIGGLGTVDWSNTTLNSSVTQAGLMELHGKDADIKVNGRSLMDAITALEERLNILVPNPELEAEWDELKELGQRYRELEKKCKEKAEVWKKLKSMPAPRPE